MLVDGFVCGDYVGRCELTAESVELLEDMLFNGMYGCLELWFVGWSDYARVVMLVRDWNVGLLVCLRFVGRREGSCKRTTFLAFF